MRAYKFLSNCCAWKVFVLVTLVLSPIGIRAQLLVDCSGTNPNAYPTISAALQQAATIGSVILVTGTCNETVNVRGMIGLNLGAPYGQTATLNGALSISNSQNVYLYGLHVTNSPIDGITINDSTAVLLEACAASGNALNGLRAQNMSDVAVIGAGGAFNNNGSSGIWANVSSLVWFNNWAGPVNVSNNTASSASNPLAVFWATSLSPTTAYLASISWAARKWNSPPTTALTLSKATNPAESPFVSAPVFPFSLRKPSFAEMALWVSPPALAAR